LINYPESVRFLYALGNEIKTAKLGLDRIAMLLAELENPHLCGDFVHVAGTNGKGSVCAMIESGLRAAGFRTGLFTSPHLVEPTERIRINGENVTEEVFVHAFDEVHRAAERLIERDVLELHPTYFETVTAMALSIFRELEVEFAILEVGLGGRLDATNVVTPRLCVITPIDYDHEALLGKGLEAIATEKAGILKPAVPVVLAGQRPELERILRNHALEVGAPVIDASTWATTNLELRPCGNRFEITGPLRLRVDCPLAGEHQVTNALTTIAALHGLDIVPEAIEEGIRNVQWPGRLERVSTHPEIILDGAHNPAGARALADYIQRFYAGRHVWLIYGSMRDKAVTETAGILFPYAQEVILTAPHHPRAVRPQAIRNLVDHPCLRLAADLREALNLIREASSEDVIFVTGTLFLVGEARSLLVQ
jgi:dihydrofolate synthase/folylpolyglutamate synthase